MGSGGRQGSHLLSFVLGAALPTALLFFLASDRLGQGLSSISISGGWGNETALTPPAAREANALAAGAAAPAGRGIPWPSGATAQSGHGGQDGDLHVGDRTVDAAQLPARHLPRRLQERRGHGAAPRAPPHRRRRRRRVRRVQGRSPSLLPPGGEGHGHEQRPVVRVQGIHGAGLAQALLPAAHPGARLQLPLHGHRYPLASQPVPAHLRVRRHELLAGQLQGQARPPGQRDQLRVLLHEVDAPERGGDQAVGGGEGEVPRRERAGGAQQDQARARRRGRGQDRGAGDGVRQRLLRLPEGARQGLHRARQLLHGPGEQGVRPQQRRRGLEELHDPDAGGEEEGRCQGDGPQNVLEVHGVDLMI